MRTSPAFWPCLFLMVVGVSLTLALLSLGANW